MFDATGASKRVVLNQPKPTGLENSESIDLYGSVVGENFRRNADEVPFEVRTTTSSWVRTSKQRANGILGEWTGIASFGPDLILGVRCIVCP